MHSLTSPCNYGCQIDELSCGTVNNINLNNIYDKSIKLNDVYIPSSVNLSLLKVVGGVDALYIGNNSIMNFLTKHDIFLTNTITVNGNLLIDGNLLVSGLIDGKNITTDNLMLNGNQTLPGDHQDIENNSCQLLVMMSL